MQLLGVGRVRPGLGADAFDGLRVEAPQFGCALRVLPPPRHHRLGSPFFKRRIVEIGVRTRRQGFERQRRRLGQIAGDNFDFARLDPRQQPLQPVDVHRLMQAIVNRLIGQRMVGRLALADQILGAGDLIGEDRSHEIFGLHAHDLRRDFLARPEPRKRQRDARDPAPARRKHRRGQHRLDQHLPDVFCIQVAGDVAEFETMRRGQRQHDSVLCRRRL